MGLSTSGQFRLTQRCCAENPHMDLGDAHTHRRIGARRTLGGLGKAQTRIQGAHTHTHTGLWGTRTHTRIRGHAHTPARRRAARTTWQVGGDGSAGPAARGAPRARPELAGASSRRAQGEKRKFSPLPPRPSGKLPLPPRRLSPRPASASLPAPADSPAPLPRRPRNAAAPDPRHRLGEPPGPRPAAVTAPPPSPQAGAALPRARSGR